MASDSRDRSYLPLACAAAPALVAVTISAVILVTAALGQSPPFWRGGPLTLAEAAALRDHGEVVRQIETGQDPNAAYAIRPGIIAARSLTPLEAAVGSRRTEMVDLLILHGAKADAPTWRRLHCFAAGMGAADVVATLDRYRPAASDSSCQGVVTPF